MHAVSAEAILHITIFLSEAEFCSQKIRASANWVDSPGSKHALPLVVLFALRTILQEQPDSLKMVRPSIAASANCSVTACRIGVVRLRWRQWPLQLRLPNCQLPLHSARPLAPVETEIKQESPFGIRIGVQEDEFLMPMSGDHFFFVLRIRRSLQQPVHTKRLQEDCSGTRPCWSRCDRNFGFLRLGQGCLRSQPRKQVVKDDDQRLSSNLPYANYLIP
jgi:hypothetical protein